MKTTDEIYNEIIREKQSGNYTELEQLNSTSKTAIWRLWIWIFAFATRTIYQVFEDLKNWIQKTFAKNQIGTLQWWISKIKAFQYRDHLQFIDGIWKYKNIDTSKQIVKQTAIETFANIIIIKVAKDDGNGQLIPLNETEKHALEGYLNKIKIVGQHLYIISEEADKLKINLRIYYDVQYDTTELYTKIQQKINQYLAEIVFNGKFINNELIDTLQKITGIIDPVIKNVWFKNYTMADYMLVDDFLNSASGYFTLEDLQIEFIANV